MESLLLDKGQHGGDRPVPPVPLVAGVVADRIAVAQGKAPVRGMVVVQAEGELFQVVLAFEAASRPGAQTKDARAWSGRWGGCVTAWARRPR
jgi:hypothetical protein